MLTLSGKNSFGILDKFYCCLSKCVTFQNEIWKYLEENHLFAHTYEQQTMDEKRELTFRRINAVIEKEFVSLADVCSI